VGGALTLGEHDVASDREGPGAERRGRPRGLRIGVQAHVREVATEVRLELGASDLLKGPSGGIQPCLHRWVEHGGIHAGRRAAPTIGPAGCLSRPSVARSASCSSTSFEPWARGFA
jgi:hypothetical protein